MLKSITLKNVRCFDNRLFEFEDGVNLIVGQNGSGKTTLIESVALFSLGKFLSASRDAFVVSSNAQGATVEIDVEGATDVRVSILPSGEKAVLAGANRLSLSRLVGFIRLILFNPQTIDLVFGPPQIRRRELDLVLCQKDPQFLKLLLEYRHVVRQRNNLLKRLSKSLSKRDELGFWDDLVVEKGLEIYLKRNELVKFLNAQLSEFHRHLVGRESELMIAYRESCDYDRFAQELAARCDEDIRLGQTSVGVHRDDFDFVEKQFLLKNGASRGEQRMAAIAFKIATKEFFNDSNSAPILLLDDVFSELDDQRRESVASFLGHLQTLISATDEKVVPESLKKKAKLIKI
ncbi:MAG: DNA replication and repair protein RecF [candidate division WS2 bacterium ADurb.Bin280]|uniref:DNA replication and repair protein RecF n=1 Tax=candidate division WS2 bacterium ADurb.Bin280 TaxID=1852829 RepID=A0A1V5SF48_9BACT|nr:MAG: DNA replication and repair protein RecF [candidate division WS2 bacterium ADurb.Bin280]